MAKKSKPVQAPMLTEEHKAGKTSWYVLRSDGAIRVAPMYRDRLREIQDDSLATRNAHKTILDHFISIQKIHDKRMRTLFEDIGADLDINLDGIEKKYTLSTVGWLILEKSDEPT